jgi:hypothetical protein
MMAYHPTMEIEVLQFVHVVVVMEMANMVETIHLVLDMET